MPHSKRFRHQKEHQIQKLHKRIRAINQLSTKHETIKPTRVVIPTTSLGQLRLDFKPCHTPLHPATLRKEFNFTRYPTDTTRPLEIVGSDGGLLCYRVPCDDTELANNIHQWIKILPPKHCSVKTKGISRGGYISRHYCLWSPYSLLPMYSSELKQDGPAGQKFIDDCKPLWDKMTVLLGSKCPGIFKEFQKFPVLKGQKRLCGAWMGCVINDGGTNPGKTNVHRDVREARYGISCAYSTGNYTGGGLILYDLGIIVDTNPGDMILLPDVILHHANEAVLGERNSIVAFTQENMFDYWKRELGIELRRSKRIQKKKG